MFDFISDKTRIVKPGEQNGIGTLGQEMWAQGPVPQIFIPVSLGGTNLELTSQSGNFFIVNPVTFEAVQCSHDNAEVTNVPRHLDIVGVIAFETDPVDGTDVGIGTLESGDVFPLQIYGPSKGNLAVSSAFAKLYTSAIAGRLDDASANQYEVEGVVSRAAVTTAGISDIILDRPRLNRG